MKKFLFGRYFWLFIALLSIFSVLVAHFVLQVWLFMPPCENCVYIRYAFFVVFLGAVLALVLPGVLRFISYALIIYGAGYGASASITLMQIKSSLNATNPFGVSGCKLEPSFHFNLPLHQWWSDMFLPKALCGFDAPQPPLGQSFDGLRAYFLQAYERGWYLVPKYEFINLAEISLVLFIFILALLVFRFFGGLFCKKTMF